MRLRASPAILTEDAPSWVDFKVDWNGIYLGLTVGVNGYNETWVKPTLELTFRARDVRAAGVGLVASIVI